MALPAFDTHNYVKRLRLVGFDEKQAEAQAELQSEILSSLVTEKLATKEDITNFKQTIQTEITELRHDVKEHVTRLDGRLNQLTWMFGFLATGIFGMLAKLFIH